MEIIRTATSSFIDITFKLPIRGYVGVWFSKPVTLPGKIEIKDHWMVPVKTLLEFAKVPLTVCLLGDSSLSKLGYILLRFVTNSEALCCIARNPCARHWPALDKEFELSPFSPCLYFKRICYLAFSQVRPVLQCRQEIWQVNLGCPRKEMHITRVSSN